MEAIKAQARTDTAYFGKVLNLTTGKECYSAPVGLRSLKEAEDRLPMCSDSARPGDVICRRMTFCADAELTSWYESDTLKPGRGGVIVGGALSCICLDLPVRDHYYAVR